MYGDAFAAGGRDEERGESREHDEAAASTPPYGARLESDVRTSYESDGGSTPSFAKRAAQRGRAAPHAAHRIADVRDPRRHRLERERLRLDGRDLVPAERRRDARVRRRPHRVRRRDRAVARVLAEVDEHADAIGDAPRRRRDRLVVDAPLDLRRRAPSRTGARPGTAARA